MLRLSGKQFLRECLSDVSHNGSTALMIACSDSASHELIEFLVNTTTAADAEDNTTNSPFLKQHLQMKNSKGQTALASLCYNPNVTCESFMLIVSLLFDFGIFSEQYHQIENVREKNVLAKYDINEKWTPQTIIFFSLLKAINTNNHDEIKRILSRNDAKELLSMKSDGYYTTLMRACFFNDEQQNVDASVLAVESFQLLFDGMAKLGLLKEQLFALTEKRGVSVLQVLCRYCPYREVIKLFIDTMVAEGVGLLKELMRDETIIHSACENPKITYDTLALLASLLVDFDLLVHHFYKMPHAYEKVLKSHDIDKRWVREMTPFVPLVKAVKSNNHELIKKLLAVENAKELLELRFDYYLHANLLVEACKYIDSEVTRDTLRLLLDEIERIGGESFFKQQFLNAEVENDAYNVLAYVCCCRFSTSPKAIEMMVQRVISVTDMEFLRKLLMGKSSKSSPTHIYCCSNSSKKFFTPKIVLLFCSLAARVGLMDFLFEEPDLVSELSKFGISSASWKPPNNEILTTIKIRIKNEDDVIKNKKK